MVVVLDEAHLVTNDRDAGRLLERLVRQARHQFGGVWMLSQKVDEFVSTELGRTLAAVAATKIVLGQEDIVAAQAREVFQLSETEAGAITPPVAGQAVVIAGTQRAVVQLMPSPVLWPWLRTGESARGVEGGAAA
jgi:type IV secretory pathway VirB4 component